MLNSNLKKSFHWLNLLLIFEWKFVKLHKLLCSSSVFIPWWIFVSHQLNCLPFEFYFIVWVLKCKYLIVLRIFIFVSFFLIYVCFGSSFFSPHYLYLQNFSPSTFLLSVHSVLLLNYTPIPSVMGIIKKNRKSMFGKLYPHT